MHFGDVLILLLLWLLIGSVCLSAGVAAGKNRWAYGWMMLALMFGPLALIAIAGLPSLPKEEPEVPWWADQQKESTDG